MTSAQRQVVYALATVVGITVTWYFNIVFMVEHGGFDLMRFVADTYANPAASSISNDLLVVVFTFLFWSFFEARRLGMRWWFYPILTFTIAIAFACPLFMLMRERRIASQGGE